MACLTHLAILVHGKISAAAAIERNVESSCAAQALAECRTLAVEHGQISPPGECEEKAQPERLCRAAFVVDRSIYGTGLLERSLRVSADEAWCPGSKVAGTDGMFDKDFWTAE